VVDFVFIDIWVVSVPRCRCIRSGALFQTQIIMNQIKTPILKLAALNMHSVSTVQIPKNVTSFSLLQPSVRIKPLNLQSASSFHVPSISINKCFYNGPRVVISPLKSSIQRLSSFNKRTLHKRHRVYPRIFKCNAKRCMCCNNLSCNSTISSTVNGRVFSVKLPLDVT
jgi:hypothetical protein